MSIRTPHNRSGNAVNPMPVKMGSTKDKRWATGRNVKFSLPDHRYGVVQVWTLKERLEDGTVRVVATHRSLEAAEAWVKFGNKA